MNWIRTGKRFAAGVGVVAVGFVAGSLVSNPAAAQSTTSFNFHDIPVRSALQLIAEEGHFNLVVSDSVEGTISLRLDNVTWEQALDIVLRMKGLEQHVDHGTHSVTVGG